MRDHGRAAEHVATRPGLRPGLSSTGPLSTVPPPTVGARLEVAGRLADAYASDPAVVGVLCGGSTGRGDADRWSDLELIVLWSAGPSDEQRRRVPDAVSAHAMRQFAYEPAEFASADDFWIEGDAGTGLLIEVGHMSNADATAALDRLLVDAIPDRYLLTVAAAYAQGVPLYGDLEPWRDRVETYPSALVAAVIRKHGQIDNFWRWRAHVERDNPHALRTHFAATAGAITHIACALSGRFWPGPKWPAQTLAGLQVAPVDLAERLTAVDRMPATDAAAALTDLVEESYDLVEVRRPDVDVDRLRRIFRFARSPWPPGLTGTARLTTPTRSAA
jgi:hypothetical protein